MSRSSTLILLGVLALLTPFSGLPQSARTVTIIILGVCIAGIGLYERLQAVRGSAQSKESEPAVSLPDESVNFQPPQSISPI